VASLLDHALWRSRARVRLLAVTQDPARISPEAPTAVEAGVIITRTRRLPHGFFGPGDIDGRTAGSHSPPTYDAIAGRLRWRAFG